MRSAIGIVDGGKVRLEESLDWSDGQRVLVIPVPADDSVHRGPPPAELLEDDESELSPRRAPLSDINRREL
jgi:hypothetical protein